MQDKNFVRIYFRYGKLYGFHPDRTNITEEKVEVKDLSLF